MKTTQHLDNPPATKLSTVERNYYKSKRQRALGFLGRLGIRYHAACEMHERDIRECDEKLKEDDAA